MSEPLHQDTSVLNLYFKVHEVALKPIVLANSDKLLGVVGVWNRFRIVLQVDTGHDFAIKHNFTFFSDAVSIAPLFEDQRAEHFDIVLVSYIDPSWRRNRHSVMTEVNKHVYAVPVNEAVRIRRLTRPVVPLAVALFWDPGWYVVTHDDLAAFTSFQMRVVRDASL